jgi:tRNA-uridine 2-sulfurtransferase
VSEKQMSTNAHPNTNRHVIVGMSGGVDSSVAALLLLEQGYRVEGLFMKNWDEDDGSEYCTARADLADAQAVCDRIGIHLHTANFAAEYWDRVFEHFLAEYRAGRTPNPDILCNKEIKFKAFLDYAMELGADFIATGHYARIGKTGEHIGKHNISQEENCVELLKGLDPNKDQSYFLHAVSAQQFAKTLFPIGELPKTRVREIAKAHNLITHDKKDSTGICFIGERRFKDFLQRYLPAQPGVIETIDGRAIGEHHGLMYHTIGQRQGLGIGGLHGASDEPWYVAEKDLVRNVLIVVQGSNHPRLFKPALALKSIHWINGEPTLPLRCRAKTRYRQPDQDCVLSVTTNGATANGYRLDFDQPQRAITPGQSAVFYCDDRYLGSVCLGGGIIERALDEHAANH